MQSSESEEEIYYEEDQVVWAKIRGYPWWPAFVDKVEMNPKREELEYTVFFFGDNTHAKLGSSKLRKFIEFYTECYPRAKTHRKLMLSIQKAEAKLRQNNQDVEIFSDLRKSLQTKKSKISNHSQVDGMNQEKGEESDVEDNEEVKQNIIRQKVYRQRGKQSMKKTELSSKNNDKDECFFEEDQQENDSDRNKDSDREQDAMDIEQEEQADNLTPKDDDQSSKHFGSLRRRSKQKKVKHRKRGRPRKVTLPVSDEQSEEHPRLLHNRSQSKRKSTNHYLSDLSLGSAAPREQKHKVLVKIQKLLNSRQKLIQYLEKIQITSQNAKQILDMNVATILLNGTVDWRVKHLIGQLKSSLLGRYFPDSIKQNYAINKLIKKRSEMEPKKSKDSREESEDKEIRKKTVIKLQKFLKRLQKIDPLQTKALAIKIEKRFFQMDLHIGQKYKSMAYQTLNSLKNKEKGYEIVLKELEDSNCSE